MNTIQHHDISETVAIQNRIIKLCCQTTPSNDGAKHEYEQMEERLLISILNFHSRNIYMKKLHLKNIAKLLYTKF